MKKGVVIGGSNGIGLGVALVFAEFCEQVIVIDRLEPNVPLPNNIHFAKENLIYSDFSFIDKYLDVDIVFYSAGFGRVGTFDSVLLKEIENSFSVNTIAPIKLITKYSDRLLTSPKFYMGIMVSIAGHISSPLFALYGATKAALRSEIESVNIELEKMGSPNRILDISPGSIKGTRFNGASLTNLEIIEPLAKEIVKHILDGSTLFIPQYDEVYKKVIERYNQNSHQFGLQSFDYKKNSDRVTSSPKLKIGYLSGTFDLFHVGHLNLLKRAKEHCDYLVVGVHKDASHKGKQTFIPFEERKAILESIKFVDKVIESEKEDCDVYLKNIIKYNILFVGSDYKGTPRFQRYEEIFADKGVKIIYFPYTQGTSSTQIRSAISK